MRYIDRINCTKISERGTDKEITRMGNLSREATRIAEGKGLALLRRSDGFYRIITASGMGSKEHADAIFSTLAEVDRYLRSI